MAPPRVPRRPPEEIPGNSESVARLARSYREEGRQRRHRIRQRHRVLPTLSSSTSSPTSASTPIMSAASYLLLALSLLIARPPSVAGQQESNATATSTCPTPLATITSFSVSTAADADELAAVLAECTGGVYEVDWIGAVALSQPLVIAAQSSVNITGFEGDSGEPATLDGKSATGLVEMGEGSFLWLEDVTLKNAKQSGANGGAVQAIAPNCFISAANSHFENNTAVFSPGFDGGRGGALALGDGAIVELKNCTVVGNRAEGSGGGLYFEGEGSSVVFKNCVLEDNTAKQNGGAVFLGGEGSTVEFLGSTVSNSLVEYSGGAVYGMNATIVVRDESLFFNNTAYESGAGIFLYGASSLNITDSSFVSNKCYPYNSSFSYTTGGAIRVQGNLPFSTASIFIADSVFEKNGALSGGALWISSGFNLVVAQTEFLNNTADFFGGASFGGAADIGPEGVASFKGCNFTGGWGFHGGGGMAIEGCQVNVSDCVFDGNSGRFQGAALYLRTNATMTLERSTFTNNYLTTEQTGGGSGAGIHAKETSLVASDCVFHNNQAGYDAEKVGSGNSQMGGGAVLLDEASSATFVGCNFTRNGGAAGGAILALKSSLANLTKSFFSENKAALHGGALSFEESSSCVMTDSSVVFNSAATRGGALALASSAAELVGINFSGNAVSGGSGGAVSLETAASAEINRGHFSSNSASTYGGHLAARGNDTEVAIHGPILLTAGEAGLDGGAVHVAFGAKITVADAELSGNEATRHGGALSTASAREFTVTNCNVSANHCAGSGGGVSVTRTYFSGSRSNFTDNCAGYNGGGLRGFTGAKVEIEDCLVHNNIARTGGGVSTIDSTLVARRCEVKGNTASADGGGLRLAYRATATLVACDVSFNVADFDGGGIAIDASAGTVDGSLALSNASSSLLCEGDGMFQSNEAGERGGAMYVTRESKVVWKGCHSQRNTASLGAAVYASNAVIELLGDSVLAYDEVPTTGAMIYALETKLEANNASFLASDATSMLAVQMSEGSSMKALKCSFKGWMGLYVVLTGGLLEMDLCDFRGSQAEVFVAATNPSTPARIRNTALGIDSFSALASGDENTALSRNVQTCDMDDPCGSTGGAAAAVMRKSSTEGVAFSEDDEGFAERSCVDGNLGVYCPCLEATVTGQEECLGKTGTVQLSSPDQQVLVVGSQGTIKRSINVTAGSEGGLVVWQVEEVVGPFSEKGLTWSIVPSVGILEKGCSATVTITGTLTSNLNGLTHAKFQSTSLRSRHFDVAMVNTTFYFCQKEAFYNGSTCLSCADLPMSDGLNCDEPGVLLSTLPLGSGYWRSTNETDIIRECMHESACKGGSTVQGSDDYCSVGYKGPYCAVCSTGYAGDISNGCHRCSQSFEAGMYLLVAVGGVVALLFAWLLFRYLVQAPSASRKFLSLTKIQNSKIVATARQTPLYKLKIPIVVFQIITQYADITTAAFPPSFTKFLSYVDVINLDLGWFLSATCILNFNFYDRLLLATLGPLVLCCALGLTYVYARRDVLTAGLTSSKTTVVTGSFGSSRVKEATATMSESRQLSVVKTRHMAVLVTATFLLYPMVSTTIFQAFACENLEEVGKTYLRADYSLMCHTADHNWYKVYSAIMILVYPVGIPMFYASLLYRHRHRIYPKQALKDGVSAERRLMDKKIAHTVLLWEAYKPSRYYYEVIECARRLLLTGCLVFILPDSAGQSGVACVLSVLSIFFFIAFRPFTDHQDDHLYILGSTIIFLTMFLSLVPKVEVADGDDQSQTVLSWLLIILSVALTVASITQILLEASLRSPRTAPDDTSFLTFTGSNPRTNGEEKSELGSGYNRNNPSSTPEDPSTDNPSLFDFGPTLHGSGGSVSRNAVAALSSGGGKEFNHYGGSHSHPSGSSEGGGLRPPATGYAEPVPQFEGGNGPGGQGMRRSGGGGDSESGAESSNTYGPLAIIHDGGSGNNGRETRLPSISSQGNGDSAFDSATMAEEMFARRLKGGRDRSRDRSLSQQGGRRRVGSSESRRGEDVTSITPPRTAGLKKSSKPYADNGGGIHHQGSSQYGGEETAARQGMLRLSPAEPMTNAFPAPVTNTFPHLSTDTPESERIGLGRRHEESGSSSSPSPSSSFVPSGSGNYRQHLLGGSPLMSDRIMVNVEGDDDAGMSRGARIGSSAGSRANKSKHRGSRTSVGR